MFFGQLALVLAAAFTGAAFYVNFAEHPARLTLDDASLLREFKPSYDAGYTMQATLAAVSAALGVLAAWSSRDWRWIVGAVLIFANWPYTLIAIMPTNNSQIEGHCGERGRAGFARLARVVGTAACGADGAWPGRHSCLPVGGPALRDRFTIVDPAGGRSIDAWHEINP